MRLTSAFGAFALALSLALPGQPAGAQNWTGERWTGTWGTAPAGPPPPANLQTFTDQTLRLIVHTSIGATPLRIGAARIGVRATGSDVAPGTDRALSFSGNTAITIPPVSLAGDLTAKATLPVQRTITKWPFLTEVDVDAAGPAIVAPGDSITDGTRSTADTNNRWPAAASSSASSTTCWRPEACAT